MKIGHHQCPVRLEHLPFATVGFWHHVSQDRRFIVLWGCQFGISSVVISFTRTPALQCAFAKRVGRVPAAFLFDGIGILDLAATHGSGRDLV